jgi:hypothetical protein
MDQAQEGGSDRETGAVHVAQPLFVLKKLDKRFGATHALKAVHILESLAGEIFRAQNWQIGLTATQTAPATESVSASWERALMVVARSTEFRLPSALCRRRLAFLFFHRH